MTGLGTMLWMAFSLGIVASLHCAQMCGPIVLAYSLHTPTWRAHAAYNAGRILTYSALGAAAGGIGGAADVAGAGKWVGMAAGVLMIGVGLIMMSTRAIAAFAAGGGGLIHIGGEGPGSWLSRLAGPLLMSPRSWNRFGLGVCLGFLPCGMIWAGLLQAAGSGGALQGSAVMAAFGVGTAGTLLAVGAFAPPLRAVLTSWMGRHSTRIGGAGTIAAGLWVIWRASAIAAQGGACHGHGA